jgi:hypothetical protein
MTTISQVPGAALDGIANVQVRSVADTQTTFVAVIFVPECCNMTVAPDLKLFPVNAVMETEVSAFPVSGVMSLIEGAAAEVVVAVATVVAVVTTVVGTVVGVFTGTAATVV